MYIKVERFTSDDDTTLSTIWIDNKFECFGLEDEYREEKVVQKTRIPAGQYHIALRTHGGFHIKYSKRFPIFHEGMLQVMDVPDFNFILIHIGNTDQDTAGCLLVGQSAFSDSGNMSISSSMIAYRLFYAKVLKALKNGRQVMIEYIDHDLEI